MPRQSNNTNIAAVCSSPSCDLFMTDFPEVVFRDTEIDIATLSSYDLQLHPSEMRRILNYIESAEFQKWHKKHNTNSHMTTKALSRFDGMKRRDLFHFLGWPKAILAIPLPMYQGKINLGDIVFPKLLEEVARVINTGPQQKQQGLIWLLGILVVVVVLVTWLGVTCSWSLETIMNKASLLFSHVMDWFKQASQLLAGRIQNLAALLQTPSHAASIATTTDLVHSSTVSRTISTATSTVRGR